MRKRVAGLSLALLTVAAVGTTIGVASAAGTSQPTVVSAVPSTHTPNINDGEVNAFAEIGTTIVTGGTFSSVNPPGDTNSAHAVTRHYILAFDENTGVVSTTFVPALNGIVETLEPGPVAGTVFVGGDFGTVNGVRAKGVALLNVSTGQMVGGFSPAPMNGVVFGMSYIGGNRLLIGGTFTTLNGVAHQGLGTLNATTGALDPYVNVQLTGHHNYNGVSGANGGVGPRALDTNPSHTKAIVVGNFKMANGALHDQIVEIDLGSSAGTVDTGFNTAGYTAPCSSNAFDTYMRSVAFAPDGSYFSVAATGGSTFSNNTDGTRSLCDTATRWEAGATGSDVQPTWIDYTGNDTFLSVAISGTAIYYGGHERWVNNGNSSDSAGPGAIPRPGVVALDPVNGMPLAWNPGRNPRGVGAGALLTTANGLYVGSDTSSIGTGNQFYTRGRVAYFPLAGGESVPHYTPPTLPVDVYLAGQLPTGANTNVLYRVDAGGPEIPAIDNGPDWSADTADSSPYRNGGSSTAAYGQVPTVNSAVPATTPSGIFNTERWDPGSAGDGGEMQWSFPVTPGVPIEVRLYFANRYTGTDGVGQRVFDVSLDGETKLDHYDIVADAGTQTGTMKAFDLNAPASGQVTIGFAHEVENPLINGIEIVRTDMAAPPSSALDTLRSRSFDGTHAGPTATVSPGSIAWSTVRGAFVAGGTLFYGSATDGQLYRASFDGSTVGTPSLVDPYNDPVWSNVDSGSGQTYRGVVPTMYGGEMQSVSGMALDGGRLYYSLAGQSSLRYRYFEPDDGALGDEFTAGGDADFSDAAGIFLAGTTLYYADKASGDLHAVAWNGGVPAASSDTVVSGPSIDGTDWRARGLFALPAAAPKPPIASFGATCNNLDCSFDGSASTAPGSTITSYAWNFGDGQTATGVQTAHTYATSGHYTVTLTVTNAATLTATTSQVVSPTTGALPIAFRAGATTNANATTEQLTIPAAVHAGDGMLLFASGANAVTFTPPAGWIQVATTGTSSTSLTTTVWRRVATAADAGSTITVGFGVIVHGSLELAAYSGTDSASFVQSATFNTAKSASTLATPSVTIGAGGSWVVSYWAAKSSTVTSWSTPAGPVVRNVANGSGSGRINSFLADSGAAVAAGPAGGYASTTDQAFAGADSWTIVLVP